MLEADGGTRCAAITGGYVALELALRALVDEGKLDALPLNQSVAAVSCGIVGRRARCSTSTTPRTRPPRSTRTSS